MDQATSRTDAPPRGWPPEQPVEIVRVSPRLLWIGTGALVALVALSALIAWQLHRIIVADEQRRDVIVDALVGRK